MTDWQQILDDNAHSLWHVVYQLLSNQHESSECFKEAFISVYEKSVSEPTRGNNIYPIIAKAAISKTLDKLHQRFQSKLNKQDATDMVVIPTNGPKPLAKIKSQELAGRLRKALSQVPAQKAQIFCLSKFIGLSNKQIAKAYDLNKNAVTVLIHQTKERLTSLLELRSEERIPGENKNILNEAVAAIKQESVSTNPPSKTLHDITSVFPASAEPQLSEAMQKKNKIVRRIKALNRFKIITAIVILAGALIIAKLFTYVQQKQLEKAEQNTTLVITKDVEIKPEIAKDDDIDKIGDSAEIEFERIMKSFSAGDANSINHLFESNSLLNKIVLAKFLGEMGDEKSIQTLELFYNETRDQLRGKVEPNPFLDAIDKIHDRLGYEVVEANEPAEEKRPTTARNRRKAVEAELEETTSTPIDVINIEGEPVENADVFVASAANHIFIENGLIVGGTSSQVTSAESAEEFSFAEIENDSLIIIIHETGFAEITKQDLQKDPTVVLTGWGYVTGQLLIENEPAANQSISITDLTKQHDNVSYSYSATTDSQGYFVFENVKPSKVKVNHLFMLASPDGYNQPLMGSGAFQIVNVIADKETEVILGENGFTVTGQLETGEDFDIEPDWAHSIAEAVGADKANPYSVLVDDTGAFECFSLPAGSYELSITLYTNEEGSYFEQSIAEFQTSFTLPGADANEITLDLGTFELNLIQ